MCMINDVARNECICLIRFYCALCTYTMSRLHYRHTWIWIFEIRSGVGIYRCKRTVRTNQNAAELDESVAGSVLNTWSDGRNWLVVVILYIDLNQVDVFEYEVVSFASKVCPQTRMRTWNSSGIATNVITFRYRYSCKSMEAYYELLIFYEKINILK